MTIEESVVTHLANDVGVSALVEDRVFAGRRPLQSRMPLVVYRRISTRRTMSHDGITLRGPLFEFSCWAENETQARTLRRAIAAAFDVASTADFRSFIENEMEIENADTALPMAIVDVRVWYAPDLETV